MRTGDGEPAPAALVSAISEGTGAERSAIADPEGRYRIALLTPGAWTVRARLGDALASETRTVLLSLQQTLRLDLEISLGASERVTVTAGAPRLDTTRSGGELRVGRDRIGALPLNGRSFTDLALLDASARGAIPGGLLGEREPVLVVNGQSARANSFLVDGLENNDQTSSTALDASFSQQVIREFVLMTHQYAPEFGRASGGILNIVTEQGGNETTGEVFAQGISRDLNAPGGFVRSLPETPGVEDTPGRLSAGFSLGGPLRRDRAFYFLAYERREADNVVPFTGAGRDGLPGGLSPASDRDDNIFLRTDFHLAPTQFLMVRLSGDERETDALNVGGTRTPEAGYRLQERDAQLAASLTSILSPDLLNEARLLVARSSFDQFAASDRPGVDRPSGTFGGDNLNRQLRDEGRLEIVDNLTWTRGPHTFKLGFDLLRSRTDIRARFAPNGTFLYDTDAPFEPGDCGDLLVTQVFEFGDDPIPCPGEEGVDDDGDGTIDEPGLIRTYPIVFRLIDGEPAAILDDTRVALFAQDSWQASERLLLDYGLRYDVSTFSLPRDAAVPSVIPNGGADRDTDNFAPRLGFTFTPVPGGRFLLRGGSGVFYDKLVLGFPAVAAITSGTRIGLIFPQGFAFEITEDLVEQVGIDVLREGLVFPEELTLRFSTADRLDTPYAVQHTLGAEWAVGARGSIEANVTRALGYHQALLRDLNPVVERDVLGIPIHRDPSTGSIAAIVTEGRSWYSGLDVGWRWRGERTWYSASYTWSKALDLGPDPLKAGISLPPDSDRLADEKGLSDSDRRHRLVLAGETGLPWIGLRVSGVLQLASAAPFNVTTGRDENLDGVTTDRPAGVGRNTGADTPLGPINAVRDRENVIRDRVGLPLLPEVRSLDAPSFAQFDLRIWKVFPGGRDGGGLETFVQVFNLLDRVNGGPVEGRATSLDFGRAIGQVGPPRTIELGMRVRF